MSCCLQSKGSKASQSKAAEHVQACAAPSPPDRQPKPQSQTQPQKLPKPYVPRKGTAAYTFLICLFREKARGRPVLSKDELLTLGEDSSLAKEPLRNASAAAEAARGNYHKTYGGWSCMKVQRLPQSHTHRRFLRMCVTAFRPAAWNNNLTAALHLLPMLCWCTAGRLALSPSQPGHCGLRRAEPAALM